MKAAGFRTPKAPKLTKAYQFFFGKDFDGAHNAMNDVLATRDVFFALKKRKEAAE